ncbi:MAG: hypothetical protein HFH43_14900 [Lachnospiraceae bacterium]|nr:hypothetical protein [Lachnospiraceae bacterium]
MEKKTSVSRKPKSQGITRGRSSNKTINKRRRICRKIASSEPNIPKTQSEFLERYREELTHAGFYPIPGRQTLKKDMDECGITFKDNRARIPTDDTLFDSLGTSINYYLRQIRFICKNHDIILLNAYSNPMLYPRTRKELFSPLAKLTNDKNKESNSVLEGMDKSNATIKSKKISKKAIAYLHFILDRKGFEHAIEDTFCKDCDTPPYFLYIETHSYCTTIAFEYQKLDIIMDKVFEIIQYFPF